VPNFLIPLVVALAVVCLWARQPEGPGARRAFAAGLVAGLGTWNSALTLPSTAGALSGLALAGLPMRAAALPFAVGFAAGYSPAILSRVIGASGASP
jgi:hypothetical protein